MSHNLAHGYSTLLAYENHLEGLKIATITANPNQTSGGTPTHCFKSSGDSDAPEVDARKHCCSFLVSLSWRQESSKEVSHSCRTETVSTHPVCLRLVREWVRLALLMEMHTIQPSRPMRKCYP